MQRNDILPKVVSPLTETLLRVESLTDRPVADGHLTKFLKKVEDSQTFQGVVLSGSLEGKGKRGRTTSVSLKSKMVMAVNLTTQGLRERFCMLLGTEKQATDATSYGPKQVVSDMLVFNADCWLTHPSELLDYGKEEIERLIKWFQPLLQRAGCNIGMIQDQWVSENSDQWAVPQAGLWQPMGDITDQSSVQERF